MHARRFAWLALLASCLTSADAVAAGHPSGASIVRLLGPHAPVAFTSTGDASALEGLVAIPAGASAESLGLEPIVPGFGRLRGGSSAILGFEAAHPGLGVELAPPLHIFLDRVGQWTQATTAHLDSASHGDGVLVGVADTGLDVRHPDFLDDSGQTRVAWILDLSAKPAGIYTDLEQKYGVKGDDGSVLLGAVYAAVDINRMLKSGATAPTDEVGHGTHVTSIAAGNGGLGTNHTPYVGIADRAQIVFARITRDATGAIDNGDLVRGAQFLFDRADFMQKPIAANLSLGSEFGPHDGTMDWEKVLATYVGPDHPGHALIAAAGNSGSIYDSPIHQNVRVTSGATMRVPVVTSGASNGAMEVWIAMRPGAQLKVGLDGPDGTWIAPVDDGQENAKNTDAYNSGVINGSGATQSPIPTDSHGAVAIVSGHWPSGTYSIVLEGEGSAELYVEGTGDVSIGANAGFLGPVREGTITLPATNAGIIAVGCTVNRATWTSIDHTSEQQAEPVLDPVGGRVLMDPRPDAGGRILERSVSEGEVAWFSSAGPTVTGVQKPEITAPGGIVVGAMSSQALPGSRVSIFTCPKSTSDRCLQVDARHGISQGTSMSSPIVAGAAALLFQRDPTLTQDQIVGLLQAGAHRFRGLAPYDDQNGPGELDVVGSLDALDQSFANPQAYLPALAASWLTLSASYAAADASIPLTVILELRTADGAHRADVFDAARLVATVAIDGVAQPAPALIRRAPGVWYFQVRTTPGLGGSAMTLGATFDGAPIVSSRTIPIAADVWRAEYASRAGGSGCATAAGVGAPTGRLSTGDGASRAASAAIVVACALLARRRRRARSGL